MGKGANSKLARTSTTNWRIPFKEPETAAFRKEEKRGATEESDFWYSVRKCAEGALLDLELLCKIAHDNQLRELFKPLDVDEQRSIDILIGSKKWSDYPKNEYPHVNGKYDRTDFRRLVTTVLDKPANTPSDEWKDEFAVDLVNAGISYLRQKRPFQTKLHQRLFQDVLDSISGQYYFGSID